MMDNLCLICIRKIQIHAKVIECKVCLGLCHIKCLSLNSEEQQHIVSSSSCWYCCQCIGHVFPFNHILDDEEFRDQLCCEDVSVGDWEQFSYKLFDHVGYNENDDIYPLDEIDPDVHFHNELSYNLSSNCRYYHEMEVRNNKNALHEYFSVCHINIRSIKSNLESFKHYMECLDFTFPIIGVTETWLSDSNCELFDIPGYNFIEKPRNEKTGGGVGIFCQNSIQFTLRDDLSLFNEYLESVFIEIPSDAFHIGQTVLIGTIYRPPGMDLYQFNTLLCDILEKYKWRRNSVIFWAIIISIYSTMGAMT